MGKKLAIKGHLTRGKEIIELFKMMGGCECGYCGGGTGLYYYISQFGNIEASCKLNDFGTYIVYTLEEFLEKYPFKVGDKVFLYDNITEGCVTGMEWDEIKGTVKYCVYTSAECWCDVKELLKYNAIDLVEKHLEDCKKCGLHFGSVRCFDKDCPHNKPKSYAVGLKDGKVIECGVNKEIVMNENKPLFKPGDDMETKVEYPGRNREDVLFDSIIWHLRNSVNNGKQNLSGGECEEYFREVVKKNNENEMKNVLAELLEHIKTTPKEDLEREFNELEEWSNVGPTVEEFMDFCNKVNKKPKYPKTYSECCEILDVHPSRSVDSTFITDLTDYEDNLSNLMSDLYKLRICRDAYWTVAGEQLGLDKPWEPKFGKYILFSIKFYLYQGSFVLHKGEYSSSDNCILVFPFEEMRNVFYENFKDLIESCKELL